MDLESICIVGYSDPAFVKNADLKSQLGCIVLLFDKHGAATLITIMSYKSSCVTRSVFAAEVIAFADKFDHAFTLRAQLQQALRRDIPMNLPTKSNCLFDIISKSSHTNENRLLFDISATRKAYNNKKSPM